MWKDGIPGVFVIVVVASVVVASGVVVVTVVVVMVDMGSVFQYIIVLMGLLFSSDGKIKMC